MKLRSGARDEDSGGATTRAFLRALDTHVAQLVAPADASRTLILPTYNGTRRHPNLTALLALLAARFGASVLLHGPSGEGGSSRPCTGCVTTAEVLRELGIEPATSVGAAQASLVRTRIAYAPIAVLAPRLATLLSRRSRLGAQTSLRSVVKLIDPFCGAGYRVVSVGYADDLEPMRELLVATGADAMLLRGTEGEPFANPRRQPQLEDFDRGVRTVCADMECGDAAHEPELPASTDASATAAWIARALAGEIPVPSPIVAQLACCLVGARRPVPSS